jgi:hypothetical protein
MPPAPTRALTARTSLASRKRRRHQDKAAEGEEGDATTNLLLKHPDTTLVTYV